MRLHVGGTVLNLHLPQGFRKPQTLFIVVFLGFFFLFFVVNAPPDDHSSGNKRNDDGGLVFKPLGFDSGQSNDPDHKELSAMEAGKPKYRLLKQVQTDILKKQVRPSDDTYNINVTLSDQVSMDRSIPDTRPPICKTFHYDLDSLPQATVVIPFYNEALSMILRTVHSVLNRSPDRLLKEIILVDDKSTREYLMEPLDRYMRLLPKVRIMRNEKRSGLIVSRMYGYRLATSPAVIFLDAHTECNVGWLETLLDELVRHPHSVIQPFVDGVDRLTLDFSAPPSYYVGSFSWDLRYTWLKLPEQEQMRSYETGQPFFTPTLVGCALAVRKDYFDYIGWFDEGLKVWGGENIELGFRTWMCGGRVVTVTCSRVGHVFKEFPYKFDGDKEEIVQKNLIRVAETWMDGFRKYFYASTRVYDFKRHTLDEEDSKSLAERIELRKKLKCKTFEWFMYNIIPQLEAPPMDSVYYGELTNLASSACWEVLNDHVVGMTYFCFFHKIIPKNYFSLTSDGLLHFYDKCVKIIPPNPILWLAECPTVTEEKEKFGIWELKNQGTVHGLMQVKRKNDQGVFERFCVTQVTNVLDQHNKEQMPQIGGCDGNNKFSLWSWTYKFKWDEVPEAALTKYGIQ